MAKRIAEPGNILFSVRAPVGRINITDKKIVIGRGLSAVRHKNNFQSFLFYQLKHRLHGTVFAAVSKRDMQEIKLISPPSSVIRRFNMIAEPIDEFIIKNDNQSNTWPR